MDRISKLCAYLEPCSTFADVACDHGYCAGHMLKNGLCESAVISDISAKSLSKAENLLSGYIKRGKCSSVCCDGLELIAESTEQILIAGIGGEEIVKILKNSFIPRSFVFQPMKNAEALRAYLLGNGCAITADDIFTDGKNFYFVVKGTRSGKTENYSKAQYAYGKDSLSNPVLKDYLSEETAKKLSYLRREMSGESRERLEEEVAFMQGVLKGEIN